MCALRGCPAMFTLLLLSCFAVAAAGPLRASPLAPRCGGTDCSHSASRSFHHSSPTLPAATQRASLNHRSDNTVSALPPGTSDTAKVLNGHNVLRGETHHPAPSNTIFSGHQPEKLEAYSSGKDAEELRAKHVIDGPTSASSVSTQVRDNQGTHSKNVLLNKLYADVTPNGRHWPERSAYRANYKLKKEAPAHLSSIFTRKSSEPNNWKSGGVLRWSWEDYNSLATKGEVAQTVEGRELTLTSISDDVSLGHSGAPKEEHADGESTGRSGITPQSQKVPSAARHAVVPLQLYRSSPQGRLPRNYRPPGTPDTRERMDQDVTTAAKSESTSIEPATLPTTSANEVVSADESDSVIIQTPDPDLEEQKEEIEEAIARDATLIIVFSCLAVASLAMWRIVRCIAMHKLKKHEKKLAADKASSV